MKIPRTHLCLVVISVLALHTSGSLLAQTMQQQPSKLAMLTNQQMVTGGVGMTIIDGKPYYLFRLFPELSFGKIGVGIDLNIRVGEDGKVRSGDFKDFYSYLRLIRYVRYGNKNESFYARLGTLDYSRLGHGSIMYMYRNSASYDLRKVGVEFDADFQKIGFESMYSDVGGAALLGLRGYVRPLQFTDAASIPVIGGLETGATLASDFNTNANKTWGDSIGTTRLAEGGGALSIVGLDVGLPLLSHEIIRSTLYADYAKIISYGSGGAVGLSLGLRGLGILTFDAKYERRFVGNQFVPSYFDAFYERDRYQVLDTNRFMSNAQLLKNASAYDGYFGEIFISILNTFNVIGGYQSPVGVRNAGTLHMELQTSTALPGILLTGGYDKKNIGSIFKLDNNSLLYAQVGYKPMPYLVVSTLYQWTWTEVLDAKSGNVVGYEAQKRIEPRVEFVATF
ncbi:MAG: hypothetical protein NTZ35_12465 [Ignavibacteriales bacterium]|nr:hypothetical protein [Ignavibacteriales bacterium]